MARAARINPNRKNVFFHQTGLTGAFFATRREDTLWRVYDGGPDSAWGDLGFDVEILSFRVEEVEEFFGGFLVSVEGFFEDLGLVGGLVDGFSLWAVDLRGGDVSCAGDFHSCLDDR